MLDWISIALSIFGVVGIGGAIALFFLAPALFAVVMEWLGKLLQAVLATRLGCALVAGALCFVAADQYRSFIDGSRCEARIAALRQAAEAARDARDAEIKTTIEGKYAPVVAELRSKTDGLQQQVSDYEKRMLANASAGACRLGADALRLRKRK